jgi:O-acetyl-ADP-ribose deacetylase (regulator of RNase III)
MKATAYLATRRETIISIVQLGTLPDNLSQAFKNKIRQLDIYPQFAASSLTCTTANNYTYILELALPALETVSWLTKTTHQDSQQVLYQADKIDPSCIQRIHVLNKAAEKRVRHYFNDDCPLDIIISTSLFPKKFSQFRSHSAFYNYSELPKLPKEGIKYLRKGDLLGSKMQTLVNTVNCVGVMGKGIAFHFKKEYPEMFKEYKKRCKQKEVQTGKPYLYKVTDKRWILNFPTKKHWRSKSQLQWIVDGLKYLGEHFQAWGIESIAIPPLGCGNGGLDWQQVQPLIDKYLRNTGVPIEVYMPFDHKPKKARAKTQSYLKFKPQNQAKSNLLLEKRKSKITLFRKSPTTTETESKKQKITKVNFNA